MLKARKSHPNIFWPLACYAAALCVFVLLHLGFFVANRIMHANGSLVHTTLSVADFDLVEMTETEDGLLTTGSDPQMHLRNTTLRVDNVRVELTYSQTPWMATAYWAAPGTAHSLRHMATGTHSPGAAHFTLPATGGQSLRLDLDTKPGNALKITAIEINRPLPFYAFFVPSAGETALFVIIPGLAACTFVLWRRWLAAPHGRKAGAAHG